MLKKILSFLKKHSDRATVIGLSFGLLLFVGMGIYLQKNNKEKVKKPIKEPLKIELQVKSQDGESAQQGSPKKMNSFFLRPSPAELLEKLTTMENLQESVAQEKLQYLPVLWPVYFFSLEQTENSETIVLDISEDGFGVAVRGKVKSLEYPEIAELEVGAKIWVAGEIIAVDPSGTGTVHLKIEFIDFSADGPLATKVIEQN